MTSVSARFLCACGSLFFTLALITTPASAQQNERAEPVDRVVAIVNDDIVTRHELDMAIKSVVAQLQQQNTPLPPRDVIEKQVLERVIMSRVQLQYAKETGVTVDDPALDKAILRIAEGNKMSLAQLQQALQKDGIDFARFREEIRNEIINARLREREVDNRIVISDSEVDNFLRNQQQQGGKLEEFNLSHILIRVPEQASPEELQKLRARAEQALAQLRAGKDFRQVAAGYSEAQDAVQGGVLGWREYARLPVVFAEAVDKLSPGQTTEVLRSPNGFHILRVNERRGQDTPAIVQQTHARHILIKTNEVVSEEEARDRLTSIKDRLDHGADFSQMARLQSEDISAARGGDLGWLSPSDTVPEFEKAMDELKPGEISTPIRTQFGWHLIQVVERRDADMSKEQQRARARMTLRAQRADETYQEWLRQLRDKAFVEYRLEEK